MSGVNEQFQVQVPPELEARLRAAAKKQAAVEFDETALLAQYVAEAKAEKAVALREKAEALATAPKQNYDAHGFPEEYVEIMVYKGHGKDALSYVPVGVNGFFWKIQRGVRVIVPNVVRQVLENAVGEEVTKAEGGLETTPVMRFPYQVYREGVSKADYQKAKAAGKAAAVSQTSTASA